MNRRRFSIYSVLGLLALSALVFSVLQTRNAQAQMSTPTPAGDFGLVTITGNVRDVYGPTQICCEATVGASISVSTSGPHGSSSGTAITDANGNFSVSNIHLYDTDTVTVTVTATGLPTGSMQRSGIATSTNKVFNFTLVPAATPTPTPWVTSTRAPADFVGTPLSGTAPLTVQFTDLSNILINACSWSYGDGTSLTVDPTGTPFTACPSLPHTYTSAGSFTVIMHLFKTDGTSATVTKTNYVQVSGTMPTPTRTPTRTAIGPTPTLTRTPTSSCGMPTAALLKTVDPVTSPTNATTQVITVTLSGGVSVTVVSEAGTFTSTTPVNNVFSVTINLVPNSANHLQVQGRFMIGSCTYATAFATVDKNGNPLTIVQGTVVLTPTPTRSPTPVGNTCAPVNSVIAAPFTFDGAGTFCWQSSNLGTYINSWNTTSVTINGVNISNLYVPAASYPAKIGGYWYVGYSSSVAWGHFEAK